MGLGLSLDGKLRVKNRTQGHSKERKIILTKNKIRNIY